MSASVELPGHAGSDSSEPDDSSNCPAQTLAEHSVVLKHDRYFLVTNSHGDIGPPGECSLGLFRDDTRVLSHYSLHIRGGMPALLSVQVLCSHSAQIDLAINDAEFGGNSWDPKNCVHIQRELLVADRLIERVTLTNHLTRTIGYWMELHLANDFADIFEIRGWSRERHGEIYQPDVGHGILQFSHRGCDGQVNKTRVKFHEPPNHLNAERARWEFGLLPKGHFQVQWEVYSEDADGPRPLWTGFELEGQRKVLDESFVQWNSECSRWKTNLTKMDDILSRASDDLRSLYTEIDGAQVITAGIPWYCTVFGRDSIIASLQTLPLHPRIAIDTLRYLARRQGSRENPFTEEQPGKILHELRRGELARSGEIPHTLYYGTIDATPLWLILLHETWLWTGDEDLVRELLPNADRALDWINRYGDVDGDGFVEYRNQPGNKGLVNQGWKDSSDGVSFPDGSQPAPPIALVEVQGYVYDALLRIAELHAMFGDQSRAAPLREQAQRLREQILRRFWIPELRTFALALDGKKNIVPTVSSNAGHLLWSGVPEPEQAAVMAEQLLAPEMFSGWGIRTLGASQHVFNPMSYHNGSVWPHDNSIVVAGLSRYGHARKANPVLAGLYAAAVQTEFERLPELFCGMARGRAVHPVWYPVSCSPQAWASGALFLLLQAALGIRPDAPRRLLRIHNPTLPDFLEELTISDLSVGKSKVSLQFKKHRERTLANLLSISGEPVQVRIEL